MNNINKNLKENNIYNLSSVEINNLKEYILSKEFDERDVESFINEKLSKLKGTINLHLNLFKYPKDNNLLLLARAIVKAREEGINSTSSLYEYYNIHNNKENIEEQNLKIEEIKIESHSKHKKNLKEASLLSEKIKNNDI